MQKNHSDASTRQRKAVLACVKGNVEELRSKVAGTTQELDQQDLSLYAFSFGSSCNTHPRDTKVACGTGGNMHPQEFRRIYLGSVLCRISAFTAGGE